MTETVGRDSERLVSLLLTGDVMTGRGIDQILPHAGDPMLYERHATSAMNYVTLAERAHGPIPRPVPLDYVWGDALAELTHQEHDISLINLETAITARGRPVPKGINYRMHPANVGVLAAARISACILANNHVLDWGRAGLTDTIAALKEAGIGIVGAGRDDGEATAPLVMQLRNGGRIIVLALGCRDSGIPPSWRAGHDRPGLNLLPDLSEQRIEGIAKEEIAKTIRAIKRNGDIAVVSIYWGGNWGREIPDPQRTFAHALIEQAAVDVIHGHSSHHPKAIEIHNGKLILYGCGDFLNDYEGIGGPKAYRSDLALLYRTKIRAADGHLSSLDMLPFRICRFRLQRADHDEAEWLAATLTRDSARLGLRIALQSDGTLQLRRS